MAGRASSSATPWNRRTSRLSLASSAFSTAESYNSFHLLAEHAGATWRELWRTRMLLIDALNWAQSAAAAAQSADQQKHHVLATGQLTSMMMAYLMGQQQQQQTADATLDQGGASGPANTPDSVMMAALMAATAAAQAAMQQGQQTHHHQAAPTPGKAVPCFNAHSSAVTPPLLHSAASAYPASAPPQSQFYPRSPLAVGCQPDLLVDHQRVRNVRHDVVCHLDAAPSSSVVVSPPRSPWDLHQPLPPPTMWGGASPAAPPVMGAYGFVPPPRLMTQPMGGYEAVAASNPKDNGDVNGSDEFDSEDEVMSTSGEEVENRERRNGGRVHADVDNDDDDDDEDYWNSFPTPEGQPRDLFGGGTSVDADDVSSVSQSASQVVVVVHDGAKSPSSSPPPPPPKQQP
ncbi:unnamed protein product [Mesocestoides corti]|nr:unnamed protein product [Mesocestoides corti]